MRTASATSGPALLLLNRGATSLVPFSPKASIDAHGDSQWALARHPESGLHAPADALIVSCDASSTSKALENVVPRSRVPTPTTETSTNLTACFLMRQKTLYPSLGDELSGTVVSVPLPIRLRLPIRYAEVKTPPSQPHSIPIRPPLPVPRPQFNQD
jgi:hypothetical protein